ncbi:hypothetical protein DB35_14875 [Streptomyces abyssalis]|uniref:Uncharacterized protein n=1 Tax=Streptomyces abyssalis TaxID=933944 RepID=A0A1E7JG47_9ACTN|nr:hypothetical protein [Streptomyces abyssalis]OEU85439.1 hypothetical protein AN215_23135 [Streptomyces abyssalis]OEU93098.1 hypothetical protein DB35_14875 [Streptomyces abyssalis]OEV05328.1 hypothetical protein AN219_36430 [Streptomyces nanshensis]
MSSTSQPPVSGGQTIADANEAIRQYVAGRTIWSQADLAELDRLRTDWKHAVQAAVTRAA